MKQIYTKRRYERTSKARNSNTRLTISSKQTKLSTKRNAGTKFTKDTKPVTTRRKKNVVKKEGREINITTKSLKNRINKRGLSKKTSEKISFTTETSNHNKTKLESRKRRFAEALPESSSSRPSSKRQITSKSKPVTKKTPTRKAQKPAPLAKKAPLKQTINVISTKKTKKQSWEIERSSPVSRTKKAKRLTLKNSRKHEVLKPPTPMEEVSSSEEESESESSSDDRGAVPKLNVHANKGALLMLRNLPKEVTTKQLMNELLYKYQIEEVSLQLDNNGNSTGIAELSFSSKSDARECMRKLRKKLYRKKELFFSLIGTNTIQLAAEQEVDVVTQKPKRKKKNRKKERQEKVKGKSESTPPPPKPTQIVEEEILSPPVESVHSVEKESEDPNPCKLRMVTTTSIQACTRPWNWGIELVEPNRYEMIYYPPSKEEDGVCYHVTMKDASSAN